MALHISCGLKLFSLLLNPSLEYFPDQQNLRCFKIKGKFLSYNLKEELAEDLT